MFDLLSTETLSPMALPLPSGHTRRLIADGAKGTAQTVDVMQRMVNSYKANNNVRKVCADAIRSCRPKDYYSYCKKCYEWVRDNIKYAYDPHLKEFCESPEKLLENRIGDCDSQDMLLCSMFENLGFASQFVTIKADPSRPDEYTHVYTRVKIPKVGWVCADPIMPEKWFGWEPPYPAGKKYWPASSDETNQPVDTSPSVQVNGPDQAPQPAFDLGISGYTGCRPGEVADGVKPLCGLSGLGRGGHGHGGRGRSDRWGGGWGYGPGWVGFDEPDIYVLPVIVDGRVPTPDYVQVVPEEDTATQAMENPAMDYSTGMGRMSGLFDDVLNKIQGTTAAIGASLLSSNDKALLATRIINGDLAKEIAQRRAAANRNSDLAQHALASAKKSGNGDAVSAANDFVDATRKEQYAINDVLAKYNEAAGAIQSVSLGKIVPPKVGMNGMGAEPITYAVLALIAIGAVSAALIAVSGALAVWSVSSSYTETAKAKALAALPPEQQAKQASAAVSAQPDFLTHPVEYLKQSYTTTSETALKYALIFGGLYLGWQFLKYSTNIAGEKVRSKILES